MLENHRLRCISKTASRRVIPRGGVIGVAITLSSLSCLEGGALNPSSAIACMITNIRKLTFIVKVKV